jgi:hypothetical protein
MNSNTLHAKRNLHLSLSEVLALVSPLEPILRLFPIAVPN